MVISADRETFGTGLVGLASDQPALATHASLLKGQVLVDPQYCPHGGGAVTAQMYVPIDKTRLWPQLTNYSRWPQFFPNITHSEVLETVKTSSQRYRRLYQVGRKGFLMLTAQVEIYLRVFESLCDDAVGAASRHRIQFRFESGTFAHFAADLDLQDFHEGTLLTYSVSAKPLIPVPSFLIEQAMRYDLPGNMEQMRRVLCAHR
ncbi:MAG: cyclase [Cyanobacteria bacterium Co-bin13]|nr:cyclase [Cyanobacteria bacterium Co-bin13]